MRTPHVLALSLAFSSVAAAQNPLHHWTDAVDLRFGRAQPVVAYTLRVDSTDLSGWTVEMQLRNVPDQFRLAMVRHAEYNERYWRYLEALAVTSAGGPATVTRTDSAVWAVRTSGGDVTVRYRIRLAPQEAGVRAAWRPFLTPTGGLTGGPDAFLYVLGAELAPAHMKLELPASWRVATALTSTSDPTVFTAPDVKSLAESPILAGRFHDWRYVVDGVPHRVVYWSLPTGTAFDSVRFVGALERLTREAVALFGRPPYREYTFMFQDGAYGGLEHPSSVTLGAPSDALARDPLASLEEAAHEYLHLWNLMRIRPAGYGEVDYRMPPATGGLWFSEGLTIYYADALLRRAGLKGAAAPRLSHLTSLIARYLSNPGARRFSAEAVSRVAYNASPDALGDYSVSTHMQGELIGTLLEFRIRDATNGERSMDDVMRLMLERHSGEHGFTSRDIDRAVADVCGCSVTAFFDAHIRAGSALDVASYLRLAGIDMQVTMAPARNDAGPIPDLRVVGWNREGEQALSLRLLTPDGAWSRAGLRTGDRVVTMNGAAIRNWPELRALLRTQKVGDTVAVVVSRPAGQFITRVNLTGYDVPLVTLTPSPGASPKQRAIRERWLSGW